MKVIFLILISLSSILNAGNFSRSNGVVSDSTTKLEWQDDYSDNNNSIKNTTWQIAINYCENLTLNAQSDWRLPNKNELLSIVDYSKNSPSVNEVFTNTSNDDYWSSTTYQSYHYNAWIVKFDYGYTEHKGKDYSHSVRCVRAGQ